MKDKIKNPVDNLYKRAEREVPEYKEVDMNKFTKELAQELVNKFADSRINPEEVYVEFATHNPNFFNKVAIIKDVLEPELFDITTGIYRHSDNMGYKKTSLGMNKKELIQYLVSMQGIESVEERLKILLDKIIYMD
jgi:hypothetical protein